MPAALLIKYQDENKSLRLDAMGVDEFIHLLATARYVQEIESYIVAKAIVDVFPESDA